MESADRMMRPTALWRSVRSRDECGHWLRMCMTPSGWLLQIGQVPSLVLSLPACHTVPALNFSTVRLIRYGMQEVKNALPMEPIVDEICLRHAVAWTLTLPAGGGV